MIIIISGEAGSGKSTIGLALEQELFNKGFMSQILDGDNIRAGINKNLSFTLKDRLENIRRISEVCKLYINSGIITISCFISKIIDRHHHHSIKFNSSCHILELFIFHEKRQNNPRNYYILKKEPTIIAILTPRISIV